MRQNRNCPIRPPMTPKAAFFLVLTVMRPASGVLLLAPAPDAAHCEAILNAAFACARSATGPRSRPRSPRRRPSSCRPSRGWRANPRLTSLHIRRTPPQARARRKGNTKLLRRAQRLRLLRSQRRQWAGVAVRRKEKVMTRTMMWGQPRACTATAPPRPGQARTRCPFCEVQG